MAAAAAPQAGSYAYMTHTAPLLENAGARAEPAAKALATLCRNVIEKPSNLRFRRIPCRGAAFKARIADCPGALTVLSHVCAKQQQLSPKIATHFEYSAFAPQVGFCKVEYPDQEYFVLHNVDVELMSAVLRELDIFLATAVRLRASRASGSSSAAAASSADEARSADGEPVDGRGLEDSTLLPAEGGVVRSFPALDGRAASARTSATQFGDNIQRQLAARAVVHRVAAASQQREVGVRRQRDWAVALAGAAAAILAGAWWCMKT